MTKIAVAYVRCSTREQEKDYSLEYQEEKCLEYIQKKEFAYYKTYKDASVPGTVPADKRDGMAKLIEDMKLRKFDVIVFHAYDRLARTMTIAYQIIGMFEEYGIIVAECQHDIDTSTTDGQTRMAMYFTFSQMEHGVTKERSKLGRDMRKKKLGWIGGRLAYGYMKPDKDKNSLPIIDLKKASAVRLIYNMYWKDNYPVSKIPDLLNLQKIDCGKYNKNSGWNVTMIRRILKDHKHKYEGGLLNENESGIKWPKILDSEYPTYPRIKPKKK